jgi:hypothetical protein
MSRCDSLPLRSTTMESLNLNTLATSLPTANVQNAEKDLLNNFKGMFNTFSAFQVVLITPVYRHDPPYFRALGDQRLQPLH